VIRAFFDWWFGQLAELLPDWLRRSGPTSADALVIARVGNGAIEAALRRNGRETDLGRFALASSELAKLPRSGSRPAVLRLTRSDILEKTLNLPLAAQAELDQVLAFEMDRETPFAPEEIYWSHRVEAVDRQQGRLSVRLCLIPKTSVAPLLAALGHVGLMPKWAEIDDDGAGLPVLPLNGERRPQHRSRRLVWAAAACCAALAVAAIVTPFARQTLELAALDGEVQAQQPAAARAEALRREIDGLSGSADLIKSERNKAGRPLEALAAVTRLFPDDTYLTEFTLRQRKLTLTGRSAGAARLIGALAADSRFHNTGFAAPVTRVEALRAEVFTITAEVGNRP